MFYRIKENKLLDWAEYRYSPDCLETDIITQEELNKNPQKVIIEDGILVLNPEWDEIEAKKEREKINMLSLTKREVFLALYKDKGITPEQLKEQIEDPEALIEFEYANEYFRGNPLINVIGTKLGYTSDELDYLFKHGELKKKDKEGKEDGTLVSGE